MSQRGDYLIENQASSQAGLIPDPVLLVTAVWSGMGPLTLKMRELDEMISKGS